MPFSLRYLWKNAKPFSVLNDLYSPSSFRHRHRIQRSNFRQILLLYNGSLPAETFVELFKIFRFKYNILGIIFKIFLTAFDKQHQVLCLLPPISEYTSYALRLKFSLKSCDIFLPNRNIGLVCRYYLRSLCKLRIIS